MCGSATSVEKLNAGKTDYGPCGPGEQSSGKQLLQGRDRKQEAAEGCAVQLGMALESAGNQLAGGAAWHCF